MSAKTLKILLFGSLGLSLFFGNSAAFAQSGDVVVPTSPGDGTSTTTNTSTPTGTSTTSINSATRFICQSYNGEYTVMYQPESQPGQYFAWATPRTLGGGWDAQNRCRTIAQRLETYRPDGLVELRTATQNGYNTVCVTSEANPSCRIVLTVPPGRDASEVRNQVFQNLTTADSGEQTIGVNTYTNGGRSSEANQLYNLGRTLLGGGKNSAAASRGGISLKPFLDRKDGGTANNLRNGVKLRPQSKQPTSTKLNPRSFR